MGLIDKLGKGQPKDKARAKTKAPKKTKAKVDKKPLFGGKKKEMTLIERMQLEESVAHASLGVVQELADAGDSAVREVEDGLLIVAFTNESLNEAGLDPSSEEFGSFAEALRSESVESIALADDLTNGVIGVIPSQETLLSLDEFDFVHDLPFQWAIVPFDLDDTDRLTVLDDTVHIADLVKYANNPDIGLSVKNGAVVASSDNDEDDFPDENHYPDEEEEEDEDDASYAAPTASLDDDDDEFPDDDEFEPAAPVDEFDDEFDDELPAGNIYGDIPEDTGFDSELDDDSAFDFDNDASPDTDDFTPDEELMSVEETKEAINRVVNHSFNNPELDLSIDMTKFDDYFDAVTLAQFDTEKVDDSELQNVISKLRQDANTELKRFRQDNMQSLRNKFTTSMRDIHNQLVESLDHNDEGTLYGQRRYMIDEKFSDAMRDIDRQIAGEVSRLKSDYNESREEFGDNAKREAHSVYDSRYKSDLDRKIMAVRSSIPSDVKSERDAEMGELFQDRRTIAQRLFDKATTSLLQTLQTEYQTIAQNELRMYDVFRKDMDVYLRKHFADEVLRAKADAEKLRQSHEAEAVRNQYDQMLAAKSRQLQEADEKARDAVAQLEAAHREQLRQAKAEYDERVSREQRDNAELRRMLTESQETNVKIGEQKKQEVQHQMKVLEDQVKAKDKELEYANARNARTQKPMMWGAAAAASIALMFGIIGGFLFGAGTTDVAPAVPQQAQEAPQDDVSYHTAPSAHAFELAYDYQEVA